MESTSELEQRLNAERASVRDQVRAVQRQAEQSYEARRHRYRGLLKVGHQIRKLLQERLQVLARTIPFEARPSILRGDRRYNATVSCQVPCELAQVKFRFALSHDSDITRLYLEHDLDILPVYVRFTPHSSLELPIEGFEPAGAARWIDDRIVEFARVFLQIPLMEPYQRDHMVTDPVANLSFPRAFARMTLKYDGQTYYFISAETCWEFERRHGIGAV